MNGIEIKKRRRSLNLTQTELAKLLGVTLGTIFNYENGARIPDSKIALLEKILSTQERASKAENEDMISNTRNNPHKDLLEESYPTYSKSESEATKKAIAAFEDMLVEVNVHITQLKSIETKTIAELSDLHKAYKLQDEISKDIKNYQNR